MINYDEDTDFEAVAGTVDVKYGYLTESIVMTVADYRERLDRATDEGFRAGLRQGSSETHEDCNERYRTAFSKGMEAGYRDALVGHGLLSREPSAKPHRPKSQAIDQTIDMFEVQP